MFTKETINSALGTFSCWQGWRGATLLPPPEHSRENPTLVNRLAADSKALLLWQLLRLPTRQSLLSGSCQRSCFPKSCHNAATHRAGSERQCQSQRPEYQNK